MQDEQNEEFDFIKEKIKNKPVNKKRIATSIAKTAGLAAVFGFVACMVFTLMHPIMKSWFQNDENPVVSIPSDEKATEAMPGNTEKKNETEQPSTQVAQVQQELQLSDYQKLEDKIYAIGTAANKSIVTVTGVRSDTDWFNTPYETEGQASGVIIANNGQELYIMTEKKVIKDVKTISVTFQNGTTAAANLKKYDGNTGIAILSVPNSAVDANTLGSITVAQLGNSLEVSEGNIVIAVGSPLGSNFTILKGNVTSVGNSVSTIDNNYTVLTTDMVGSKDGSGVLLNLNGQIIGLIMQNYSTASEQNTLTALSISDLKAIIGKLTRNEDIPYLGLKVTTVTSDIEKKYDLPRGVYIKSVEMDSPAQAAGLQSGDIITEINGTSVQSVLQYEEYVRDLTPKTSIGIKIMRQGTNGYTDIKCQAEVGILQ